MRLIDADKLHYIRKWFEDSGKGEVVVFAKEIDKAPIVEAIPIKWIKKQALEHPHLDGTLFYQMIRQWEKENGKE